MTKLSHLLVSSALMLASCSHEHHGETLPAEILGERVTIRTVSGQTLEAVAEPTSVGLVWRASDGTRVDSREVREVEASSHITGLLQGMGIGLAAGAGVGAIIGLADGDDSESEFLRLSAGEKAVLAAVAFSVPGLLIGGLIGALAGSHDRYVLFPEERFRVSATPIAGGGAVRIAWSF